MIKFGKELFQDHVTQVITILASLALAIVAQKLSGDIANMSLTTFVKEGYSSIIGSEQLSLLYNVLLPFFMYILSCACLLWMGITNIITCNHIEEKSIRFLKVLLGFTQLLLFGVFIVMEGKLFMYFSIMVFTVVILVFILHYVATVQERARTSQ
ncbi:hypothetical protein [Salinibacillus xinjiangensis]|uniref:Uncharacterized protein n=1 Tax=Salinibacillus xinjiangensis TaxID=1229268 RepID=A0A6G1X4J9_9BACI|nr:hypothetical protein [Salinibacillus xinjiangensis]MRG85923.1 hypothetical protein [Salinibacillus xinjiangensis]